MPTRLLTPWSYAPAPTNSICLAAGSLQDHGGAGLRYAQHDRRFVLRWRLVTILRAQSRPGRRQRWSHFSEHHSKGFASRVPDRILEMLHLDHPQAIFTKPAIERRARLSASENLEAFPRPLPAKMTPQRATLIQPWTSHRSGGRFSPSYLVGINASIPNRPVSTVAGSSSATSIHNNVLSRVERHPRPLPGARYYRRLAVSAAKIGRPGICPSGGTSCV